MSAMKVVPEGAWVEIQQAVLAPGERAEGVSTDTAATPLLQWVDDSLITSAALDEEATIRTVIGRTHIGALSWINPGHSHSFGETVNETPTIGTEYES